MWLKGGVKGKPSKVAKRRLHETPKEFAEAEVGKQSYEYQRWQRMYEREAEWYRDRKMPSHPRKATRAERLDKIR